MGDFQQERYETAHFYMIITDGVLYFEYKPIQLLYYEVAKDILKQRLHLQGEVSYPIFCRTTGIHDMDKGARDLMAAEGSLYTKAVALVDQRFIAKTMADFYIRINRPLVPTSVFKNEKKALRFLRPYI